VRVSTPTPTLTPTRTLGPPPIHTVGSSHSTATAHGHSNSYPRRQCCGAGNCVGVCVRCTTCHPWYNGAVRSFQSCDDQLALYRYHQTATQQTGKEAGTSSHQTVARQPNRCYCIPTKLRHNKAHNIIGWCASMLASEKKCCRGHPSVLELLYRLRAYSRVYPALAPDPLPRPVHSSGA
jgi:hypothetical protein